MFWAKSLFNKAVLIFSVLFQMEEESKNEPPKDAADQLLLQQDGSRGGTPEDDDEDDASDIAIEAGLSRIRNIVRQNKIK